MFKGHLYIGYEDRILDCGIAQAVNDPISVNISQTPIVSYSAENSFAFDTGATRTPSFTLIRANPPNAYDPFDEQRDDETVLDGTVWEDTHTWCNRLWMQALFSLINRWQAKTDGCVLSFYPVVSSDNPADDADDIYQHGIRDANVYLRSVSIKFTAQSHETLNISISTMMGSMTGRRHSEGIQ